MNETYLQFATEEDTKNAYEQLIARYGEGFCFVDEVLRGTNTIERIAASAQILKSLSCDNVLCFAATHDIELTYMLEDSYSNYHFQEEVIEEKNDILFDYILYSGRAVSRNAIKLLSMIGYEKEIIKRAERSAEEFLKKGEWRC